MRLMCTVCVVNRQLANLPMNQKYKHVKSTLALCQKPKSLEYCIILFSTNNKNGTKYAIKDNIQQVLTRFVHEGKATIQFKHPQHNLCVQAECIQLKSFLSLLKQVLENKENIKVSSMAVTAINANVVAPKKLVIQKRGDYPLRGFPRTLEILQISDINRCSVDRGILQLCKLKILNLSNNLIESIPEELKKLPCLSQLILSNNQLGKSAPRQWDWMGGNLSKSLKSLDLTGNQLTYLPDQLVKLYNLISLNVDRNQLTLLPSGIGNLKNLRVLTASNNQLTVFPGSTKMWKLDELDLSHNNFHNRQHSNPAACFPKHLPVCTLRECAAKIVLFSRRVYDSETLPMTLIKYLDLAKYCVCGKACFDQYIKQEHMFFLANISNNYSLSGLATPPYVPMDCYFCSLKCFSSSNYNRSRNPIVR